MELRHLRYFLAVAEEKHFGRAAAKLHMAQPPLSSQIKQLEAELGTVLFERSTRKVELTAAGELFQERAQQLLTDLEATRFDVTEVGRGAAGVLRVGFSGTATYWLMPAVVRLMQEELPQVRLHISGELLTPNMEAALIENRLDVAILRPPVNSSEITLDEFEQSRLTAVFPLDHPLAQQAPSPVNLADLAGCDFVSYVPSSTVASSLWELSRQAGFRPRIVQEATETSTLMALVGAGLGVGIIPGSTSLALMHARIVARPLSEDVTIGLATAWRTQDSTGKPLSDLLTRFTELTRQAAENLKEKKL